MNKLTGNNSRTLADIFDGLFIDRLNKVVMFIMSLVIAMVVCAKTIDMGLKWFVYCFLFPAGIIMFFEHWLGINAPGNTIFLYYMLSAPLFWIMYFAIMGTGIIFENTRFSKKAFYIFCLLLMLDVNGWSLSGF